MLARERRHEVQRHARGVSDRLVLVPDQFRQRAEEVAIVDDDLVAVGSDRARDLARVFELVERAILEPDRERLQRPVDEPRHQDSNRAAVDTAGQEHPERHVAHQPQADRFFEQAEKTRNDVFRRNGRIGPARRHIPILANLRLAALEHEQVTGQQLVDVPEHRLRARTCTACSGSRGGQTCWRPVRPVRSPGSP